ncbi:MAG: beta-propeller fold lactonase family protein [Terracidiphilus sp.]
MTARSQPRPWALQRNLPPWRILAHGMGIHKSTAARFANPGLSSILTKPVLLALLAVTACGTHNFPQYPPNYREYAYITNSGSGTVTVLDVVNLRVDRELQVGQNPAAVMASPTRNEVYVVNSGAEGGQGSISVIDSSKNAVSGTILLHRKPVSIDLDSAGALAYVANSESNSISIVDLKTRREVAQIGTGEQPVAARITPDGKTLVVANQRGNSVSIIDMAARRVRSIFADCPGAADVAILPDSSKAFVACSGGHQVLAIALADAKETPATPDRIEAVLDVGRGPMHLALKPDGGEVFVSNSLSDSISEIDTSKDDVGGAYMIGDDPVRGLVSNDNSLLYVANFRSQYVTIYSIDDGKRLPLSMTPHVGDGPAAMAFSSSGLLLFVVDNRSSDVAVLRTDTRSMISMLPTGRAPNAIAVKAFKVQ